MKRATAKLKYSHAEPQRRRETLPELRVLVALREINNTGASSYRVVAKCRYPT